MGTPSLGVVADDLSGAAECASHALLRVSRSAVVLAGSDTTAPSLRPTAVLTVDADSRRRSEDDAVRAVRTAAVLVAGAPVVVKKVDSLLRGHVAAEVAALAEELQRTPVVAVANPALDRVVRDGVLHVGGTPLHDTDLWAVEPTAAPTRVAEALHPFPTVLVPHPVVALGVDAVADALVAAADARLVAVCDAVTEADLEVVHAAATRVSSHALLVGSGALAAVAARALSPEPRHVAPSSAEPTDTAPQPRHDAPSVRGTVRSALFVLGTRAPGLADQLDRLSAARSAHTVLVRPEHLLTDPEGVRRRLVAAQPGGVVVVTLDPAAPADPSRARRFAEALADVVAPAADAYDALFLSGGETARAVLDRLGVDVLDVVAEVETGTVVSIRPGGRAVVTRPGSFGDADSLVRVAAHLLDPAPHTPATHHAPVGATTSVTASATTEENR